MRENRYFFNEELLKNIRHALNISIVDIISMTGLKKRAFQNWVAQGDMPMDAFIVLCNKLQLPVGHFVCAGSIKKVVIGGKYRLLEKEYQEVQFKNLEWGDEVTLFSDHKIDDVCRLCGISRVSFYRYFRRTEKKTTLNLTISQWIGMCNRLKVYPMDFLCPAGVDVPVLDGFRRKQGGDTLGNYSALRAVKARMEKAAEQLEKENRELRRELREARRDAAYLKKELSAKRMRIVALEEELDGKRMRVAEDDGDDGFSRKQG